MISTKRKRKTSFIAFTAVRLIVSRDSIDLISTYRSNKIRTEALLLREKVIEVGEDCLR